MIAAMSVFDVIHAEIRQSQERLETIVHIRVTTDALASSPVKTMLSPERARQFGLRGYAGGADADLAGTDQMRELLIHPEDWAQVRLALPQDVGFAYEQTRDGKELLWGIPVVH